MLTRLYIDNFLCLVNFELELDETNVLLGPNGCGKTSVLKALSLLQQLITHSAKIDEVMSIGDLTRWQSRNEQRFELTLTINENIYHYTLVIEHDRDRRQMRIIKELLTHSDKPIFNFRDGNAQLYHDDYTEGPKYPFNWSRSGVGYLNERPDNKKLTEFKRAISRFIIVSPCPPSFQAEARSEDSFLSLHMENFVSWYRHVSQENMGGIRTLFEELEEAMPGFDSINLTESGENSRAMKIGFGGSDKNHKTIPFRLDELSDGQRLLVALYSLIHLAPSQALLFLDEPDNYLALREIQPFLVKIGEQCGDTLAQAVIISHHPVTIDYMAGARGRWFYRDGWHQPCARESQTGAGNRRACSLQDRGARVGEMSGVKIVLLCEDTQTESFVHNFLKYRNFSRYDITPLPQLSCPGRCRKHANNMYNMYHTQQKQLCKSVPNSLREACSEYRNFIKRRLSPRHKHISKLSQMRLC